MTEVRLTSPDRVLFPEDGITKGDLFEYYGEIAPVLVPHLRNRPFTMKRWREGIRGGSFFQKQAPKGLPDWVKTKRFRTHPREGGSRLVDFVLVNDEPTLLSMVQMHCIDMNAWYSRVDKPHRPDFVLFDLDPPEGFNGRTGKARTSSSQHPQADAWRQAIEVAQLIRARLETLDLESHVKTSGSTGIHVLVPIARRSTFEDTYEFAELVSRGLADEHDGLVTVEWLKEKRRGVLVDHRQNGWGKTIASAYSVRPRPGAPVSTPLRWKELKPDLDFRDFTMDAVLERIKKHGDLFEPVLHGTQALGPALREVRKSGVEPAGRRGARARGARARSA
jgi:bifunctional non-homologous end joining protein LigD